MASGTDRQRWMFQDALDRWWLAIIHFFGPRTNMQKDLLMRWKIKTRTNEVMRQEFLDRYVPRVLEFGFTFPDPVPHLDKETGRWLINDDDIDWAPLEAVKRNEGPETQRRLESRRSSYEAHRWVREAMSEPAFHAA
jgi:ring-1,2-phenylacetyl-CoA epoxidase subunit PaaA